MGNKLKVQSNLKIETRDVLKKEDGEKTLEMYEEDYDRLFFLKHNSLRIDGYHCISKKLIERESQPVKTLLNRWGDRTSECILGREVYLVIKDFDNKLIKLQQGFQRYRRLSAIEVETFVTGKEVHIEDIMVWRVIISLPEMEITSVLSHEAGNGLWKLLAQDMTERPEGYLSFEEAVAKLNERVEQEG